MAKQGHLLIPGTHEYVTFHGKRDFAGVIKVEMRKILLDYPGEPNLITRALKVGIFSPMWARRGVSTEGSETEEGATSPGPEEAGKHRRTESPERRAAPPPSC